MEIGMKGQGATEYLVLLAVVLIIALVSIALLGFFPGLVPDARITQSTSYWQSARPFAIKEAAITGNGVAATVTGSLVIQNNDASGTSKIKTITIGGVSPTGADGVWPNGNTAISFGPGETRTLSYTGAGPVCASGTIGDFAIVITYTSPNTVSSTQTGSKTLTLRCQ